MYGKHVELKLSNDITIRVFVWCTPDTAQAELERMALTQVEYAINARRLELSKCKA